MKAIVLAVVAALGLALLAAPGLARPGMGMGADPMERIERMAERLELTEEQQDSIAGIVDNSRTEGAADHVRMRQIRNEMRSLTRNFDEGQAQALADELGQIMARQAYARTRTMASVYQVLTPDQQGEMAKLEERLAERKGMRSHGKR